MRDERKPGEQTPDEHKPGERTPDEHTDEQKPGERTPDEHKPGERTPDEQTLGELQSDERTPLERTTVEQDPVGRTADEQTSEQAEDEPAFGLARTETPGEGSGFRFAAIGALLIVVLFAGYGLGRLNGGTGGTGTPAAATTPAVPSASPFDESRPHVHGGAGPIIATGGGAPVSGLSLSGSGLTLTPVATAFKAGEQQRLEFTVNGPGGAPVTTFAVVHDKPLHLIVARRDLTGFQHLHPVMAADGTWSVDLTLAEPGVYRMFADFTAQVGGAQVATTLGSDLTVAGDYAPVTVPDPVRVATTDGLRVGYEGTPVTESTQPLLMSVTDTAGKPVTPEPYLGAYGHLVVLRQGDLGCVSGCTWT